MRIANILFLTFLLANLVMPAGWVHRALDQEALADPPAPPPPQWPFGNNFVVDTSIAVHSTLFDSPEPDRPSLLYATNEPLRRIGSYSGQNNDGQPFDLHVIAHYIFPAQKHSEETSNTELEQIAQQEQDQLGLFWGTMSTETGSLNVIGTSMTFAATPGDANNPATPASQWIVPMIDCDLMMNYYMPHDSEAPFNYHFNMMSEHGGAVNICNNDDDSHMYCVMCENGGGWCPHADPDVCVAQAILDACIDSARNQLAICTASAVAAFALAAKGCSLLVPGSPAGATCLLLAMAGLGIAVLICFAICGETIRACREIFNITYNAAAAAACAGQTS